MENKTVTLVGPETLDLGWALGQKMYESGARKGQPYRIALYGGYAGAVPEEAYQEIMKGCSRISLALTQEDITVQVLNEETGEEESIPKTRRGLNIVSYTTKQQYADYIDGDASIAKAEARLNFVKAKAQKELDALEVE